MDYLEKAAETLKSTRPTAVDLFHVIDRTLNKINEADARLFNMSGISNYYSVTSQ